MDEICIYRLILPIVTPRLTCLSVVTKRLAHNAAFSWMTNREKIKNIIFNLIDEKLHTQQGQICTLSAWRIKVSANVTRSLCSSRSVCWHADWFELPCTAAIAPASAPAVASILHSEALSTASLDLGPSEYVISQWICVSQLISKRADVTKVTSFSWSDTKGAAGITLLLLSLRWMVLARLRNLPLPVYISGFNCLCSWVAIDCKFRTWPLFAFLCVSWVVRTTTTTAVGTVTVKFAIGSSTSTNLRRNFPSVQKNKIHWEIYNKFIFWKHPRCGYPDNKNTISHTFAEPLNRSLYRISAFFPLVEYRQQCHPQCRFQWLLLFQQLS